MQNTITQRSINVQEFLGLLPASLGFSCERISDGHYHVKNEHVTIDICFERWESDKATIDLIVDGHEPMAYWILRHIRKIPVTDREHHSFAAIAEAMGARLADLFQGDMSAVDEYKRYADRILDHMFDLGRFTDDHPINSKYRNFDIEWLLDLEAVERKT